MVSLFFLSMLSLHTYYTVGPEVSLFFSMFFLFFSLCFPSFFSLCAQSAHLLHRRARGFPFFPSLYAKVFKFDWWCIHFACSSAIVTNSSCCLAGECQAIECIIRYIWMHFYREFNTSCSLAGEFQPTLEPPAFFQSGGNLVPTNVGFFPPPLFSCFPVCASGCSRMAGS